MNLLLDTLRSPDLIADLSASQWDLLLRVARREKLLGHLGALISDHGLEDACPQQALDSIGGFQAYVDFYQVQARREVREVHKALAAERVPLVLLKGAAYLMAGLPVSRGRMLSDVDILVPRKDIGRAESRLSALGWETQKIEAYDQRYYRQWMHEIPPMRHRDRGMEVDIHHTLLPLTSRLRPDPTLLWQDARVIADGDLKVLAPVDMVIHSATHLFHDGDLSGGLRDLVDMHRLFQQFAQQAGFWAALVPRARQLQLARPLYYALHFTREWLGSPIPETVLRTATADAPPAITDAAMKYLAGRVLSPWQPRGSHATFSWWLLYCRSHWLRMPPWLLTQHLARKSWRRMTKGEQW